MDRTIIAPLEQMRDFDYVEGNHDVLYALGYVEQDTLGSTATVVSGLAATQTTVASLTINIAAGRIYQQAVADAVSDGSIPQDLTVIEQQGLNTGQTLTFVAPASGGQSQWNLVEAQFSQVDAVRSGDPNGGIVPFYNSANPNEPIPTSVNTVRQGRCILQVIQGGAATTGSEAPPTVTSGWVPLYLIDLTNGQTQITNGEILVAGPSVGTNVPSNYLYAPFLAGLLQSHHDGNAGQAPKIKLASEVQGVLPAANMQSTGFQNIAVYKIISGTQQVSINGGSFTSTGATTFPAPPSGVAEVELNGGGGGAGGTSGNGSIAGSGGGGEYVRGIFTGLATSTTVTVGPGGAAGTTSPTNGTAGGTTSFGAMTALGGGAGNAQSGAGANTPGVGGSGGVGGTDRIPGSNGSVGQTISTTCLGSYAGGSYGTPQSAWEVASTTTPGNGQPGLYPGGGGGASIGGGTSQPGASGRVVVKY